MAEQEEGGVSLSSGWQLAIGGWQLAASNWQLQSLINFLYFIYGIILYVHEI
jgi:hypothetical protein